MGAIPKFIAASCLLAAAPQNPASAQVRDICGDRGVIKVVQSKLLGPNLPQQIPIEDLRKALEVTVVRQVSDETGRRVRCIGNAQVSQQAVQNSKSKLSDRDRRAYQVIEMLEDGQGSVAPLVYLVTVESDKKHVNVEFLNPDEIIPPMQAVRARLKRVFLPPDPPQ